MLEEAEPWLIEPQARKSEKCAFDRDRGNCTATAGSSPLVVPFLGYVTWEVKRVGRVNARPPMWRIIKRERPSRTEREKEKNNRAALTLTLKHRPHRADVQASGEIIDDGKLPAIGRKSWRGVRSYAPSHSLRRFH